MKPIPNLPYSTQWLGAYRPTYALPGYVPHEQLGFEVQMNVAIYESIGVLPTPLACMENWLQMGMPHRIPETVWQAIVKSNTDERTALLLLARLTRIVIKAIAYHSTQGQNQARFVIATNKGVALDEAFACHWDWLCRAFAPDWIDVPQLSFTDYLQPNDKIEADFAVFLTSNTVFPPDVIEYVELTNAPICLAVRTAEGHTAYRSFTKVDFKDSAIAYPQLLTLDTYQKSLSQMTPQHLLEGDVLCHSTLSEILAPLLYASVAVGHQTLIIVPHEVALHTAKYQLQALGIDAVSSINTTMTKEEWLSKWTAIINAQRVVVICVAEQLLHPFWQECAKQWHPDCLLYTEIEQLSPWHNPTSALDIVRWQRLNQLFPKVRSLFQSAVLTEQDTQFIKRILPPCEELGMSVTIAQEPFHDKVNICVVEPNPEFPTNAYYQAKQSEVKRHLEHDRPKSFALLCPHTKGSIGISDGVYMGMAARMRQLYDKPYHKPICSIPKREHSYQLFPYLYGQAQGAVTFMPLMGYILHRATAIYALGLPNTWTELHMIQQQQVSTTFILADDPKEESRLLHFRLQGSFPGEKREYTLAMLLLKAIVSGMTLSLSYPSSLSQYLDNSLETLGYTPIAHHHPVVDKPERYQQVILQALAILQTAECVASFSYCLYQGTIEAEATSLVDTYKLRTYISDRYKKYYPYFLTQIDEITKHFYPNTSTNTVAVDNAMDRNSSKFSALWHWLTNKLKG